MTSMNILSVCRKNNKLLKLRTCQKLGDSSASMMQGRHLISDTNSTAETMNIQPHENLFELAMCCDPHFPTQTKTNTIIRNPSAYFSRSSVHMNALMHIACNIVSAVAESLHKQFLSMISINTLRIQTKQLGSLTPITTLPRYVKITDYSTLKIHRSITSTNISPTGVKWRCTSGSTASHPVPISLTWINFNPSMDK